MAIINDVIALKMNSEKIVTKMNELKMNRKEVKK